MRKIILSLFIIVGLCNINTAIVSACSCASPFPSPQESLKKSTVVFAGKVTGMDIPNGIVISTADPVLVTFDVSEIWKGPDYKTLVVTTARDGVSCGYSFEQGEEYIVYAYGEEDKLSTNICSRTELIANAKEDLQGLGKGNLPTNSGSNINIHQTFNLIQIFSIVFGIIVLIVIIVVVRKYKK